jgi:hypothetical protein
VTAPALVTGSPLGLHRVLEPPGVLPQAAWRLDARAGLWPDEVRVRLERLNLDAASFRQLREAYDGDPAAIRAAVLGIVADRGKMQNPVTGSGGMLTGVVEEAGPASPLGLRPGDRIATLVSLSLTPLVITDGLEDWDAASEQVPCEGHAILFGRSIATVLPDDPPGPLALAVMDVCGAPALTHRVVAARLSPVVAIIGAAGKSGSLSVAAARQAGAGKIIGVVRDEREAAALRDALQADGRVGLAGGVPLAAETRMHGTRSGWPRPYRKMVGRPTSRSSAWTCPAARAAPCCPPPRAGRSSSSPWPPRSPRPHWARKGWPRTSRCSSAMGMFQGTPPWRWTCCAPTRVCGGCSRAGSAAEKAMP